ncbi:DUF4383 domain-containing protein [Thermoactinomyces sp. DSM 45892]|uniref:DUF4383 domain-containing protein n=1 Tax=Thermoactinomyces sp. DSM 45892 TaxID=1882753 RepID=UPI000895B5E1|nr:DUF4383 domain-containing protein [Thermoactinomyces sp. DSM 45892]SDZ04575.1 protein of unknown function [Thermoactinomyces sp. DSM 45892]
MNKQCAVGFGALLLVWGIVGFFLPDSGMITEAVAPSLWSNLLYVVTGVAWLASSSSEEASKMGARVIGVVYALLALSGLFTDEILGVIQATLTNEIIMGVLALVSLCTGFSKCSCGATSKDLVSKDAVPNDSVSKDPISNEDLVSKDAVPSDSVSKDPISTKDPVSQDSVPKDPVSNKDEQA